MPRRENESTTSKIGNLLNNEAKNTIKYIHKTVYTFFGFAYNFNNQQLPEVSHEGYQKLPEFPQEEGYQQSQPNLSKYEISANYYKENETDYPDDKETHYYNFALQRHFTVGEIKEKAAEIVKIREKDINIWETKLSDDMSEFGAKEVNSECSPNAFGSLNNSNQKISTIFMGDQESNHPFEDTEL